MMKYLVDYYPSMPLNSQLMYLIGIDDLSYNMAKTYSISKAYAICQHLHEQGLMVVLNLERLYFDNEFTKLEKLLKRFKKLIDYVSYSDFGVYELTRRYQISSIYHASTMITSAFDAIEIQKYSMLWLGKEIAREELLFLDQKMTSPIGLDIFGKFPIFYSRRELLSSFFDYHHLHYKADALDFSLQEETREMLHPIRQYTYGTIVYEEKFYYLQDDLTHLNHIAYGYLSSQFLSLDDYSAIINAYLTGQNLMNLPFLKGKLYQGLLNAKTILTKMGD